MGTVGAAAITLGLVGLVAGSAAPAQERDAGANIPKIPPIFGTFQESEDLTGGLTAEDLAEVLVGEGVTIESATYTGAPEAAGTFSDFGDVFEVGEGVALSSGAVAGAGSNLTGPNVQPGWGTEFGEPGYGPLDSIVAPDVTYDAAVLEIEFVPAGEAVDFRYVFGSEEYNEYVDQFNDVFAFFVNGENCAVVGDGEPVSINTINNEDNPELFIDNELPEAPHNTELDGFTVALTCASEVEPDVTNTLVLAIADTRDAVLDASVLIEAGSFQVNEPPVADDQAVYTPHDTPVDIELTGSDPEEDALTYQVVDDPENGTLDGTAPNLTYTPADGFAGDDAFTFTVSDGARVSEPATVSITVGEPEATPTPDPTPEPTPEPTPTFEPTPTPEPSPDPTDGPSPEPTSEPTPETSVEPTPQPTNEPGESLPDTGAGSTGLAVLGAGFLIAGLAMIARRGRVTG